MRLPEFVKKISPIGETLAAIEVGGDLLTAETQRHNEQLSVSTADTGLSLWEADYALSSSGDTALRRARIRAAMAGSRTLTVGELKALAVTVGGADGAEVAEDFAGYRVTLYALYEGRLPQNLTALQETIRRRRPAHLSVEVEPLTVLRGTLTRYTAMVGKTHLILQGRMET